MQCEGRRDVRRGGRSRFRVDSAVAFVTNASSAAPPAASSPAPIQPAPEDGGAAVIRSCGKTADSRA